MSFSTDYLVSEALAAWITDDLNRSTDFAREGLPDCDIPRLMAALASAPAFQPSQFSLALVGFGLTTADLQQIAAANNLLELSGLTNDLHEATEWRNRRDLHPRIVALARGYNPSVHGLQFFARASSSTLAKKLLSWAQRQSAFQATPPHRDLLETLATRPGLSALRSLDGVARFLSAWSSDAGHGINAPREALPELGLLADPKLFEADDLGRALERNLQIRESVTVLTPGEIRQLRVRAARYNSEERRRALVDALDRLAAFRRGAPDGWLTVTDAELLVRPPRDVKAPNAGSPEDAPTPPVSESTESEDAVFTETAIDALLSGQQDDLDAIGSALDEAWAQFEENNDTLVAVANTSRGAVQLGSAVDPNLLAWVRTFCAADRFGGLVETEVLDLQQALERSADCDPVFILPEEIWRRDGRSYSMEDLLAGWDQVLQPANGTASLVEIWRRFVTLRTTLAGSIRQLVIHPREWLDTHSHVSITCRDYLDTARDLYHSVQQNYQIIWSQSRDWAQATLDALLSLDIVQVRMQSDGRTSAKAVMLPLHPLHLWRYSRLGSVLRGFTDSHAFEEADRAALIEELRRPEHFLSVVRVGATPAGRGLNQLLPVANDIHGLATFENLHNAVSSADGVETLVQALDHYILLYPNHSRPLRVAVINAPEPAKLLERLVKLLDERRHGPERLLGVEVDIVATEGHRDRLIAAATLDGRAQDLVHEKVAAGRLDLRVSERQAADLRSLINVELADRCYHVVALFDEASISIRRRRVERLLPMSPLCVRNEIVVDNMLGDISLSPHPGEPPFSDFVTMIQELEREQRDSTMFAAADADALRATIDALVTGPAPKARWAMLADRALPSEDGMQAVRLLARTEGRRQVLICAGDHGRLARLIYREFQECNLSLSPEMLDELLRQGANLVGAGLLDVIKKQTGQPDRAKVIGFIGMLLAARQAYREDPRCLVAAVDSRIARLWLRLAPNRSSERCDLLALRYDEDAGFRLTCIEVKTTLDTARSDEAELLDRAARQIVATASVIDSALNGQRARDEQNAFAAPRLEMLKEVLVRAALSRWSGPTEDDLRRRFWGPKLRDLFNGSEVQPVRVDGDVVLVKLRSVDDAQDRVLRRADDQAGVPIRVRTVTEPLAELLLTNPIEGAGQRPRPAGPAHAGGQQEAPQPAFANRAGSVPSPPSPARPLVAEVAQSSAGNTEADSARPAPPSPRAAPQNSNTPPAIAPQDGEDSWPPPLNSLGMIGQIEAAQELVSLARRSQGWGTRFPDKLFVGPAGVGKSTLARRLGEDLLRLSPILFNGADLRRPEMIVDRLREDGKVPAQVSGTVVVQPCLVFIDEVHAIPQTVATALLSALDDRRTTTVDNVVYDFRQVVFLLATTDPGRLSEAFLSRPTRTTLQSYSLTEMAGIVWLHARDHLDGAELPRDACVEIAARMQCSPRPSVNILDPLTAHFYTLIETDLGVAPTRQQVAARMTAEAIGAWFEARGVDSNGLNTLHREYLTILRTRGAAPEDELRRSLGISNRSDFVEVTEYLTRLGLVQTGQGGRSLTSEGRRWMSLSGRIDLRDRISRRLPI